MSELEQKEGGLYITSEAKFLFDLSFVVIATSSLAILSMILNTVNMAIFVRLGLQERINFTLFCLSLTDFMGSASLVATSAGFTWTDNIFDIQIEMASYIFTVKWLRNMFYDISTALTVYISIERCICVMLPFHFKSFLIVRKSKLFLLCIAAFVIFNYVPILASLRFSLVINPETNSTFLSLVDTETYLNLQVYNDITFGVFLAAVCQICILVCVVLMYRGLWQSKQLLKSSHGSTEQLVKGLSQKDRNIVRMIFVLAILYMVSSMPQIVYCWSRIIIPELARNDNTQVLYLNWIIGSLVTYMGFMYGTLSFFVYFIFNRKFRQTLLRIGLLIADR